MTDLSILSTYASDRSAPAKRSGWAESIPILPASVSLSGVSNVWVSAGTVPGVYQVTASYPGFTNATAYVIDPIVDINGDFFRNGTIADNPREADPVCFTNDFGIVIPCNNNDSDGDGTPDCQDNYINGNADYSDMGRIQVSATGVPMVLSGHEILYQVEMNEIEDIPSEEDAGVPSLRLFNLTGQQIAANSRASSSFRSVLTNVLSSATNVLLFAEGTLHGACSDISLVCLLDGEEIGRDTICLLTFPFVVLSNLDIAEKVIATSGDAAFWAGLSSLINNQIGTESLSTLFLQDYAEIGLSGRIAQTDEPHSVFADFWNRFYGDHVTGNIGYCNLDTQFGFDGGNVEASPPDSDHPNGCILLGSTASQLTKSFLERQRIQTCNGSVVTFPTDWLRVGHVDEIISVVPDSSNSPYYLVGDLELAISILQQSNDDVISGWDLPSKNTILGLYQTQAALTARDIIQSNLTAVCSILETQLNVPTNRIIRVPVLYKPKTPGSGNSRTSSSYLPNSLNMTVVALPNSCTLFAVPEPFFLPFEDFYADLLVDLGHDEENIGFVSTLDLHPYGGEAHCGSNVQRIRP